MKKRDLTANADGTIPLRTGMQAVILAGGRGTRLAPYTSILPKPLMPIGDRAILEIVVDQLEEHGFDDITFCVGYLSHLIRAVFDARDSRRSRISYVHEEEPLGTAGPLRLIEDPRGPFVVMNGDILTTIDYCDLLRVHREHGNLLTISTHRRVNRIDYGVLHLNSALDPRVTEYIEKPEYALTVSMGIYVVEPRALDYLPASGFFDFPDLVKTLLAADERVGAYEYEGMWFDIGRPDDYEAASNAWLGAQDDASSELLRRAGV